ncbi:MAG: methyltransferase domain-containing protein [Proteobacteria bacterium]|nr:methyltransferase domain-containing protein [Pseudomonadota bacterium]
MSEYRDYGFTSNEPGQGNTARALAPLFVALVRQIQGVESVCDLGCGSGHLVEQLSRHGYRVTGIDASKSGIAIARQHYAADSVTFICNEIAPAIVNGLLKPGSFDVVVSCDVIEHLYRPSSLIETAVLLLKPGGVLLVGTPYHGYLKNLAIGVLDKWDAHHGVDWDGGHIKFFSVRTLRELVSRHGFGDIRFTFYGRLPWLWKNMICAARLARRPE